MSSTPKGTAGNIGCIVVKLGTRLLTTGPGEIDLDRLAAMGAAVHRLRDRGAEVVLVSSGAVGLGMGQLGLTDRPVDPAALRACAAIGQSLLMNLWRDAFEPFDIVPAQMLLTRDDFRSRASSLNVHATLRNLLKLGVVPVINENDSVSDEEIRFGDNDVLSALLASLCKADLLIMLSTAEGLVDREGGDKIVPFVEEITPEIEAMAGGSETPTSVGGMVTKLEAAKISMRSGCACFVGSGYDPSILDHVIEGEAEGTFFAPAGLPLKAGKQWLAFFPNPRGALVLDEGACKAIIDDGKSLLAKGLSSFRGEFSCGDVVAIETPKGEVLGRGMVEFSSDELPLVQGKDVSDILSDFPDRKRGELVHRDHLALLV
ncbi:MAG: glutamate 5-kinase [Opitutales bacterium]|jgi:glutamate 5-kinase